MNFSLWWIIKATAIYRWLEKDAKKDEDVSYTRYKEIRQYTDNAEYVLKTKEK